MNLADEWEHHAQEWIAWARSPAHDTFWQFHRDQFLDLLPPPGRRTVDIGCGEGRLTRHLAALGHSVVGIDASPALVAAARDLDPSTDIRAADAAAIPLPDSSVDLAIAFMSLHDIDPMSRTIAEAARVLEPDGKFCFSIVHPLNSAGRFEDAASDAKFVIPDSYLSSFHYSDSVEREGLRMTFSGIHRPLEAYFEALEDANLVVETLREPTIPTDDASSEADRRWRRLPLFLHVRARLTFQSHRLSPGSRSSCEKLR